MEPLKSLDQIAIECGTDKSSLEHNYTPYYEAHFERIRNLPLKLLEIGIDKGYSLKMWSEYFPRALIYGLDIKPLQHLNSVRITALQGSQADPDFLNTLNSSFGPFDIIVDDGSHFNAHMRVSFDSLFPLLKSGGTYVVEDLYCCYWNNTGRPLFTDYLKTFIGPLFRNGITDRPGEIPYFDLSFEVPTKLEKMVASMEFYKDLVFITKI